MDNKDYDLIINKDLVGFLSYDLKYIYYKWVDINPPYKHIEMRTHFKECNLIDWFYYLKLFKHANT